MTAIPNSKAEGGPFPVPPASRDFVGRIITADSQSLALLDLARRVAAIDANVMLGGPTGCGKKVIAR